MGTACCPKSKKASDASSGRCVTASLDHNEPRWTPATTAVLCAGECGEASILHNLLAAFCIPPKYLAGQPQLRSAQAGPSSSVGESVRPALPFSAASSGSERGSRPLTSETLIPPLLFQGVLVQLRRHVAQLLVRSPAPPS